MLLPNAEQAVIDLRKLRDYCLSPTHPRGKHKAKVFARTLGVRRDDAAELRARILTGVRERQCQPGAIDAYGVRYLVDIDWQRGRRRAIVRTTWIVKRGESKPRLTSCYVV